MNRKMKKMAVALMSASMLMGSTMPAMAADPEINAPIYSFDVVDVIVPTTYAVAFNPEGLTVKTDGTNTSTDQILSKNFGIVNKSSKDKLITVTLTVEDQNTGANKVTFVDTAAEVSNASDGEYKIHLTLVPADTTEVKVGSTPAAADKDTAASVLGDVAMTKAAAGKEVTLKPGENKIGFKLEKATYSPKSGSEVTLGTTNSNNVQANYEITALAASGKGITAFTFGGEMNANADWFKLTGGIKITPVYTNETAPSDTDVIDGTGAMVTLTPAAVVPSISSTAVTFSKATGAEITVDLGVGDLGATGIEKVATMANNQEYVWATDAYTLEGSKLTFKTTAQYIAGVPTGQTRTVKVTFNDTAKTAVDLTVSVAE